MIKVHIQSNDNPSFLKQVECITNRLLSLHCPKEIYLVNVDNWFGEKWLGFSGKIMGAFGVGQSRLTIPPFVPNRIISQRFFSSDYNGTYLEKESPYQLHIEQESENNLHRRMRQIVPNSIVIWYSGNSKTNGRGVVMAYIPIKEQYITKYVEFESPDWNISRVVGGSKDEIKTLINTNVV
mgnify:CR=1 FL=1